MSLAVDGAGRVLVLDQINGRLVRHNASGEAVSAMKISQKLPQDVAVSRDGAVAVLDRLGNKAVGVYDSEGVPRGELPLLGDGLDDTGLVTGVVVDGKDVYVEREHSSLLLIGDTSGKQAGARTELPGRPSRDGKSFLSAGITSAPQGRVWVSSMERAMREHSWTRELRLGATVTAILLLDTDKSGTIYFAAEVQRNEGSVVLLTCLEPAKGAPVGSAELPANMLPEESFRDLSVLDDGGVVYAHRTDEGVTYSKHTCKP